jgi:hypothetical protein
MIDKKLVAHYLMKPNPGSEGFATEDLGLAAYLYGQGCALSRIRRLGDRRVFVFHPGSAAETKRYWYEEGHHMPVNKYVHALRTIRRMAWGLPELEDNLGDER